MDQFPTGTRRIVSAHDFAGRPDRLYNTLAELQETPASVNKIVWTARTIRDNVEAFEILLSRQRPTIALCMGEAGLISRLLAKKFGAFLTFAALDDASGGTAPGQIGVRAMIEQYRWRAIDAETSVYGVVGSPIAHSRSPAIQNAAFEALRENAVYLPMLVNEGYESFKAFIEHFSRFAPLHLRGLSVTLPHKENALRYLKSVRATIEPLAERIGAVNTIVIERDGGEPRFRGMNTDHAAIVDTIVSGLQIQASDLKGCRVAVIGAGGTGRTAVAALTALGATVVVYNRTRSRADALAAEFTGQSGKVVAADLEKLCDSCCQIYINTTSLGLPSSHNESPFGDRLPKMSAETLAFDVIYNPPATRFLRQAAEAGAKTLNGVEMFIRQAAAQCEAWTGKPAPTHVMREAFSSL